MQKRISAMLLSVIMLLTLLSAGFIHAQAASEFAPSEQCVEILKKKEGFCRTPYWDYGQWTVGYGTRCPDDKLDEYRTYGISEEAADELLDQFLKKFSDAVNAFNDSNSIGLNQSQFDALILFTYNCGTNWMNNQTGEFRNAVVSGATGNDFIYPITLWCSAGDEILPGLITRRLMEANMYLNGVYEEYPPDNYTYVRYNANGGTVQYRIQGYDANQPVELKMTASLAGYTFAGWYSARKDGYQVTVADANTKGMTLYARWLDQNGNVVEAPYVSNEITPVTVTVMNDGVNLREGPGTDYATIGEANKGDSFTITATAQGGGYTWGQFSGGWIALTFTNFENPNAKPDEKPAPPADTPVAPPVEEEKVIATGMVHTNELKIREGAGFSYKEVGTITRGNRVEITKMQDVDGVTWGKIGTGWVSMQYILVDDISSTPLYTGTIVLDEGELSLRQGPGFAYEVIGTLKNGEKVSVVQKVEAEDHTWGRTDKGWFSMRYFREDSAQEEAPEVIKLMGTVNTDGLNMRSAPGTDSTALGKLNEGARVEILETKQANGLSWGKISLWSCLQYVNMEEASADAVSWKGTVSTDELNIRTGAGLKAANIGYLKKGSSLEFFQKQDKDNLTWGQFYGWICLDYVTLEEITINGFTDVPSGAYYSEAVSWAVEQGITTGKTATTFQPSEQCTRAQIAAFLWRANGKPTVNRENPFTDVPSGKYYSEAVLWAVEKGITTGKTENTFQPDAGCTRAQVVTFLWRAAGEPTPEKSENPFTDIDANVYYYEAVLWAVEQGITTGKTETTFQPSAICSRAQIVTFLYRAMANA